MLLITTILKLVNNENFNLINSNSTNNKSKFDLWEILDINKYKETGNLFNYRNNLYNIP